MQNKQHLNLTDKDMCQDILGYQKYALGQYTTMITETSDPKLRALLIAHQQEIFADQYTMWEKMMALGYYKTKPAAPADISLAVSESKLMAEQLNC
ncbi:MAG: spore coat protein [Firmicutes bacterium]|nr:spore coat protein [Bacillota bacterium]